MSTVTSAFVHQHAHPDGGTHRQRRRAAWRGTAEEGRPIAGAEPPTHKTLGEKIDHLFATMHPAKGEYTHEQVAKAIEEQGRPTISATYLWQLRKGMRDNPTKRHLEALGNFFGVPAVVLLRRGDAAQRSSPNSLCWPLFVTPR